jgi:peptidoglycan hydrolase-like protein with peptidoglycan-binding domain
VSPRRGRPDRRTKRLAGIVGAVAAVGIAGWFAGSQMQSPADAAASHRAPEAGPVTVAVERQKLTATVITQGTVEYGEPQAVALAGPVGPSGSPGAEGDAAQLVTKLPSEDAELKEGGVLMHISGRPVMVLRGTVPMYRTLGPGNSGEDIEQLQQALRRIGFDPGGVTGDYRQGTAAAVERWYASKGFTAQSPGSADEQQLAELEAAVTTAQLALMELREGDGSSEGGNGSEGEGAGSQATRTLRLGAAEKELQRANKALSAFKDGYGTKVPAGEVVFLPELPVRVDEVKARLGQAPDGPVATVTSSDLVVKAVVPGMDAATLRVGMTAQLRTMDGTEVRAIVSRLGDGDGKKEEDTDGVEGGAGPDDGAAQSGGAGSGGVTPVPVEITLPDPGPLRQQSGASVKVTVEVGTSRGAVLTVPSAAVRTSADGQARVRVERDGHVIDVPVTVGLSAAGLVEVEPDGAALSEQDRVVVGK